MGQRGGTHVVDILQDDFDDLQVDLDVVRLHSDAFFQDEIGAKAFAGGDQSETVVEPSLEMFEGEAKGFLVRLNDRG